AGHVDDAKRVFNDELSSLVQKGYDPGQAGALAEVKRLEYLKNNVDLVSDLDAHKKLSKAYEDALTHSMAEMMKDASIAKKLLDAKTFDGLDPMDFDVLVQKDIMKKQVMDASAIKEAAVNDATFHKFGNRFPKIKSVATIPKLPSLFAAMLETIFKAPFRIMKALMAFLGQAVYSFVKRFDKIGSASDGAITKQSDMAAEIAESANNKPANVIGYDPVDGHLKQIDTDSIDLEIKDIENRADGIFDRFETGTLCSQFKVSAITTNSIGINGENSGCPKKAFLNAFGYSKEYLQKHFDEMTTKDQRLYKDLFDTLLADGDIDLSDINKLKSALKQLSLFTHLDAKPKLSNNQVLAYMDELGLTEAEAKNVNDQNVMTWLSLDENGRIDPGSKMAQEDQLLQFFKHDRFGKPQFYLGMDRTKIKELINFTNLKRVEIAKNYNQRLLNNVLDNIKFDRELQNNNLLLVEKFEHVISILNNDLDIAKKVDPDRIDKIEWFPKRDRSVNDDIYRVEGLNYDEPAFTVIAEMELFVELVDTNEKIITLALMDEGLSLDEAVKEAQKLNSNTVHKINHLNGHDSISAFQLPIWNTQLKIWELKGDYYIIPGEAKSIATLIRDGASSNPFRGSGSYLSNMKKGKRDGFQLPVIADNLGIKDSDEMAKLIKAYDEQLYVKGIGSQNLVSREKNGAWIYGVLPSSGGLEASIHKLTWDKDPLNPEFIPSVKLLSQDLVEKIRIGSGNLDKKLYDLKLPFYDSNGQVVMESGEVRSVKTYEEFRASMKNGKNLDGTKGFGGKNILTPEDAYAWDDSVNDLVFNSKYDYKPPRFDYEDETIDGSLIRRSEKISTEFIPSDPNVPDNSVGIWTTRVTEMNSKTFAWADEDANLIDVANDEQSFLISEIEKKTGTDLRDGWYIPTYSVKDSGRSVGPNKFLQSDNVLKSIDGELHGTKLKARTWEFTYLLRSGDGSPNDPYVYRLAVERMEFYDPIVARGAYDALINRVFNRDLVGTDVFFSTYIHPAMTRDAYSSNIYQISGSMHYPSSILYGVYGAIEYTPAKTIGSYVDSSGLLVNFDDAINSYTNKNAAIVVNEHYYAVAIEMGYPPQIAERMAKMFSSSREGFKRDHYGKHLADYNDVEDATSDDIINYMQSVANVKKALYSSDDKFKIGTLTKRYRIYDEILDENIIAKGEDEIQKVIADYSIPFLKKITESAATQLDSNIGLDSTTSVWIKQMGKISLSDIGDFVDEYKRPFIDLYSLLSDPTTFYATLEEMLRSISRHESNFQLDTISSELIEKASTAEYIDFDVNFDEVSSDNTFVYPINYNYYGQSVSFDLRLSSNFTSMWFLEDGKYISKPIIVEGLWNPKIFIDPNNTNDIQGQINMGKIPRPSFSDSKDPLNLLRLVYMYDLVNWQASTSSFMDSIINTYAIEAKAMDSQLLPFALTKYEQIILNDAKSDLNFDLYNKATGKNETIVDFIERLSSGVMKEQFKSLNPSLNNIATKQLTSNIIREQTVSKFEDDTYTRNIINQVMRMNAISDTDIGETLLHEVGNSLRFDSLFVDIDITTGLVSDNIIFEDRIKLSPVIYLERFEKTNSIDPFSRNGVESQYLHNLLGANKYDFVYPSIAYQNSLTFVSAFKSYYTDLGLISPNRNLIGALANSVSFSLSFDFFDIGVRNNYGRIPIQTQYYLQLLSNSNNFYTSSGELLISMSMKHLNI
ncbi:MAG: hypothetical protein GPJ54_01615, partial [Candidatus Heimdallarchaeota archaeon]|nr:hypothetical protein [Candidatus Heimdallarchaeota archaeon]